MSDFTDASFIRWDGTEISDAKKKRFYDDFFFYEILLTYAELIWLFLDLVLSKLRWNEILGKNMT